jgi:tetratricopeptide (TPR) repeat protein
MQPFRLKLMVSLLLIVSTFAVYVQVRNHGFVNYDDNVYVTDNRIVQDGVTWEGFVWALTTTFFGQWYPLTWLSHMADCQFFGLNPGWHHLSSVFLHITNTLLLFLVFRRMTGDLWRSGFVAALFALHPLHVESVAWVSDRKDVLSAFFWMLTMWSYVRYIERPGITRYLLVALFFVMCLMGKATVVTLPFVLLLLDYWPFGRFEYGPLGGGRKSQQKSSAFRLISEKAPLFSILAAASVLAYLAKRGGETFNQHSLDVRIANALVSYVKYIEKMIWPSHLTVFYPHPNTVPAWQALGAIVLLLSVSLLAFRVVRSRPYFAVGWLWYIGTLVPVIGVVQVGSYALADRYTYVPMIGLFVIIAWGVPELVAKWRYRTMVLAISTGVVLSALMIRSWQQVRYWKNNITLFTHTLDVTTDNWLAHNNLGNALAQQGKLDNAIAHYSEALRIAPDFAMAHNNFGFALAQQGRLEEAIRHYTKALQIEPAFAEAHTNLGGALASQGRFEAAISHCSEAVRLQPNNAIAHNNLGHALARQGRLNEAMKHFSEALRIEPNYAKAYYNLGIALARQGKLKEAIPHFSEALRIRPDFPEAQKNLKRVLWQAQQSEKISKTPTSQ